MRSEWPSVLAAVLGVIAVGLWLAAVSAPARRTGALMGRLLDPGVSTELAAARARAIRGLSYELAFEIPDAAGEPVRGLARIRFDLAEIPPSLIFDFAQPSDRILSVRVADRPSSFEVLHGHLLLPSSALRAERNEVVVEFLAGDEALNRNADFLYTLFVPARAHFAFPCFDQPDLKARYALTLDVPAAWEAVANGAESRATTRRARAPRSGSPRRSRFRPISSPSPPAGSRSRRAERNGRTFRMLHRETDAAKVARNRDAIFDLHARGARLAGGLHGHSLPVRQVRLRADPVVPVRRHGARRRDLLQRVEPAARRVGHAEPACSAAPA